MQIVINIPKKTYDELRTVTVTHVGEAFAQKLIKYIKNGTPLPKGHGRLIDEERISLSGIHFETKLDHVMMIGRLNSAPTIIEAEEVEE